MISETVKVFGKLFLVVAVVFTVAFYALSLILGPALFYFTSEGLTTSMIYKPYLPAWILILPVAVPVSVELGAVFLGVSIVITASFVTAWKFNKPFHQTIKNSVVQPTKNLFQNNLFAMIIINSMTLIAVLILSSLQEAGGIPTGTTPTVGEPFLDFLDLSYSVVVEEIGFRLIPIGAFLLGVLLIQKREVNFSFDQKIKFVFMSFLVPDIAKRMIGKKTVATDGIISGISLPEWGMVIFTSLVFGMAHFNPGVSWEIGKISSATLSGFVLAITYIAYGIHAPLLMHWFFNSYNEAYYLLAGLYPAAMPLANTVALFSFTLGIMGWLLLLYLSYRKFFKKTTVNPTMQKDWHYSDSSNIS